MVLGSRRLVDRSDAGLAYHGLHAVATRAPRGEVAARLGGGGGGGGASKRQADEGEEAAEGEGDEVVAGVLGATAALLANGADDDDATRLDWSVGRFQALVASGAGDDVRSAVARALYQGVKLRMARAARPAKGAKKQKVA